MEKYCCRCEKKLGIFSSVYPIGDQVFCSECASDISQTNSRNNCFEGTHNDSNQTQTDVYYSGLVVKSGIRKEPVSDKTTTKDEIENNLRKINNLPQDIKNKILQVPQFKIFFENNIPYYITQNDSVKKELPKVNGVYSYYDPVEDTEAYKIVIEDVKKIADKEYEEEMIKEFGTKHVFGGVHRYYAIEAHILYEKYGIDCVNNPMDLNPGLYID